MKKRPIIGLLCITLVNQPEYAELGLDLEEKIQDLGIDVIAFTPYGIQWERNIVSGKLLDNGQWIRGELPLPQAIYNRLYGTHPNTISKLATYTGDHRIFNWTNRLDKYLVYQSLSEIHQQILPLTLEYTRENLISSLNDFDQVVLKPKQGHYGLNIYRIHKDKTNRYHVYKRKIKQPFLKLSQNQLLDFIEQIQTSERQYLIQQFIEPTQWNGRYFDIRVLVQKDHIGMWQVTAMISRVARKNHFATNDTYKLELPEILLAERNGNAILTRLQMISIHVAQILEQKLAHFGELSIDFIIDRQENLWLIEVNGKPRKDLFAIIDNNEVIEKVYLRPLEYAKYLAERE
ncbi:MAG: hypothetical protein GX208_08920 [Firmicutes bacterium]|nr:hypothetical protein [Bacillota bacterium]